MLSINRPIHGTGSPGQPAPVRDRFGIFLRSNCMFSSNSVFTLVLLLAFVTAPLAHADRSGATYHAKVGDCLSGIVKAHYPDTTGHSFVLRWNPDIVDDNQIDVGQGIVLPGLSNDQILQDIDQTGCNAASLAVRKTAKSTVTEKASAVASARNIGNQTPAGLEQPQDDQQGPTPEPAMANTAKVAASTVAKGVAAAGAEATASTIPVRQKTTGAVGSLPTVAPMPARRPTTGAPATQSIISGTRAVPIDSTQRTVAVPARGRPTRASAPMTSQPRFAVDDEPRLPRHAYRQSTPNRYVVNAIGARTSTASTALVQHPDQHFYVESRADWQGAMRGHAPEPNNATPAANPASTATTALDKALAQREEPRTQSAGNIFIDESLLLKAAAKSGDQP